ncbi:MAG: hypothetical protein AAB441_01395 [Patescibacteria group bacterium]
MENFRNLLNENQGVLTVALFLLGGIGGFVWWLIGKNRKTSTHKNSPHITAGGNISVRGNINVGNFNKTITRGIPEFHLHLYGAGLKRAIKGHIEKKDNKTLIVENISIDGLETTLNRQFIKFLSITDLNISDSLFTDRKQDIVVKVIYRTLIGERYELFQTMSQENRADGLFNIILTGIPSIKALKNEN